MFRASICPSSGEQEPPQCKQLAAQLSSTTAGNTSAAHHMWYFTIIVLLTMGLLKPETALFNHSQQYQCCTSYAVVHYYCSPDDGHINARNMLR
jgi:hypothetical protein